MLGLSYESVDKVGKPFQEKGAVCTKAQRLTGTILAGFQAECSVKVWMSCKELFLFSQKAVNNRELLSLVIRAFMQQMSTECLQRATRDTG